MRPPDVTFPNVTDEFERRTFRTRLGGRLPYRLLKPKDTDPGRTYPLVLLLHGAGERGDDNVSQLKNVCSRFLEDRIRRRYPCFVAAPQCPEDEGWMDWQSVGTSQPVPEAAEPLRFAVELAETLGAAERVDRDRVYVTGLSMGGFGTWDAVTRWPGLFAAAVPVCGGGAPRVAHRAAGVPVWAFHGADDAVVPAARSREMVEALRAAGGNIGYTEFEGVGHNAWDPAFADEEVFAWLLEQRRGRQPP